VSPHNVHIDPSTTNTIAAAIAAFLGGGWLRERRKMRHDALAQALEFIDRQTARIDELERQVAELQRELYRHRDDG
jgi:hypothetical protein